MKKLVLKIYLLARATALYPFILLSKAGLPVAGRFKKILIIRIDRLGDMVMTLPAIHAVKEKFHGAEVFVLTSPVTEPLLSADPSVKQVLVWDPTKGWAGLADTLKKIRALRFDLAIDPFSDYELKTALIAFASGAALRLGYDTAGRGVFFNLRAAPAKVPGHMIEESFGLLQLFGIARNGRLPDIFVPERAEAVAGKLLADAGVKEGALLIAVHPGGHYPSQRWFPDRFKEVAARLVEKHDARILLIGNEEERQLVDEIAAGLPGGAAPVKSVNVRPDILCALLRRCRLFLGNNSGPLHLAGALKVPSVSTMGPTDPVKWMPLGPDQVVLKTDPPCAPCGKGQCGPHDCMRQITVAMMLESAEKLLAGGYTGA